MNTEFVRNGYSIIGEERDEFLDIRYIMHRRNQK